MSQLTAPSIHRPITDDIPSTKDVASLPRKERRSAKKLTEYISEQHDKHMILRTPHAEAWIKVRSIMRGFHYFSVKNGLWRPQKKKPNEIRAVVPIMEPRYRWELGRLNSNRTGATAVPKLGLRANAGFKAQRAEAIINHWHDEIDFAEVFDTANQHLLYYGMQAYYRYADQFRQNVFIESVPSPELFPIPFDATSVRRSDGIMRVKMVTREWLELQDESYEREYGEKRVKPMASQANNMTTTMSASYPGLGGTDAFGGSMEGAVAKWVWMKPNPQFPNGEMFFIVGDTMYGYQPNLPDGKTIPMELVYYTQKPDDFHGTGFCAPLISMQREANRQWTSVIKAARHNKPLVGYDPELMDPKDAIASDSIFFPMRSGITGESEGKPPWHMIPAIPQGREVGAVLQAAMDFARQAVGHDSNILFGQSEGRTEGGPANSILNSNAQAPLQPVIDRIRSAHSKTYSAVLDMLPGVWPAQKRINVTGQANIGREMLIVQHDEMRGIPASEEVEIVPFPLMPNGRNAQMSLLFQMRQMPGDDGRSPMLTEREFRRSLLHLGAAPPGIDMVDKTEERILFRIGMLINDGKTPAAKPVDQFDELEWQAFRTENHKVALEMLRDKILDPGFALYSDVVRVTLLKEMQAHIEVSQGNPPVNFDDDAEYADAQQSERFLYHAELDPSTSEGQFTEFGF